MEEERAGEMPAQMAFANRATCDRATKPRIRAVNNKRGKCDSELTGEADVQALAVCGDKPLRGGMQNRRVQEPRHHNNQRSANQCYSIRVQPVTRRQRCVVVSSRVLACRRVIMRACERVVYARSHPVRCNVQQPSGQPRMFLVWL